MTSDMQPPENPEYTVDGREEKMRQNHLDLLKNEIRQIDQAFQAVYDGLYEFNVEKNSYRVIYRSRYSRTSFSDSGKLDEALGLVAESMLFPEDSERFLEFFDVQKIKQHFMVETSSFVDEFRRRWADGTYHWTSVTIIPLETENNDNFICFVADITEKKEQDIILEQSKLNQIRQKDQTRYQIIAQQTGMLVMEWDKDSDSVYYAGSIGDFTFSQYSIGKIFEEDFFRDDIHEDDFAIMRELLTKIRNGSPREEASLRIKKWGGSFLWGKLAVTVVRGMDNDIKQIILTILDIDKEVRALEKLQFQAEYDQVTGIYNQVYFESKAQEMVLSNPDEKFAVVRMDVNRFKLINDLYGQETGNKVLKQIAKIMQKAVTPKGVCGRITADIFDFCIPYGEKSELLDIIKYIEREVIHSLPELSISVSFGICVVDDRAIPLNLICDRASMALRAIKGNAMENWGYYSNMLREKELDEQRLESEMTQALKSGEFVVYLQPKYYISTGKLAGAESLVYWKHPSLDVIPPNGFIMQFERNGFILQLDEYIWKETCRILRGWIDKGYDVVPVSVNFSRTHMYQENLAERLLSIAKEYDISPNLLIFELTETVALENIDHLASVLHSLQVAGFTISMDDFGSGFSSLNLLKDISIDELKLDRLFLDSVHHEAKSKVVIESIITLAKQLQLKTVAEGVETEAQLDFLKEIGCDIAQGFYFSKPLPEEVFESLIKDQNIK